VRNCTVNGVVSMLGLVNTLGMAPGSSGVVLHTLL
jgi:hypothetical protein